MSASKFCSKVSEFWFVQSRLSRNPIDQSKENYLTKVVYEKQKWGISRWARKTCFTHLIHSSKLLYSNLVYNFNFWFAKE